jgi:hypothetical protein
MPNPIFGMAFVVLEPAATYCGAYAMWTIRAGREHFKPNVQLAAD